ncbi:energy-coupling factor transporter transmembrane protein EcfT [Leucobacter allii]|uniref:energy-coupling factor transporter transmembrane component T family protein n=1 Tax=Leucobacter allii TaxID=2932247 RepID=UPI001FD4D3F9|nr:energy-coupling factor transporter transmembrane component T [Leucobacter allii]UOR02161.1 energy-coupling factor transporter transmembrane protein EcfT [Leucobacter allii]
MRARPTDPGVPIPAPGDRDAGVGVLRSGAGVPRSGGLHPATELVLLGCALVLVYGLPSPLVPALLLVGAGAGAARSPRVRFGRWLATLAVLAGPMLLVVGVVQGLFYPGADATVLWERGPVAITVEGLAVAAQLWLRVAAMIGVCALFAFGADSARTFDGMIRLRAPLGIAYVCATAMSLVPLLRDRISHALDARAARGWDTSRAVTRLRLLPGILAGLLSASLVELDQRHDALEQRGFGRAVRPAPLQEHPDGRIQTVLRWGAPLVAAALLVASAIGVLPLPTASELIGALRG